MRMMLLAGLSMTFVCLGLSVAGDESDPVRDTLDKAKKAYQETMTQAREALTTGLDNAIKDKAKAGDLDGVRTLRADKEAFDTAGKVPSSSGIRALGGEYEKTVKAARKKLDTALEDAMKEYTKSLKIELAEAVQGELKTLRGQSAPAAPATAATPPPPTGTGKKVTLDYTFYEWKKGDRPVKMLHKDDGFCHFIGIRGGLDGSGESAQITLEKDGYWYLHGKSLAVTLDLRAVGVKVAVK